MQINWSTVNSPVHKMHRIINKFRTRIEQVRSKVIDISLRVHRKTG